MKNVNRKLGARIREIRKARGMTQERLAEKADITPRYLSRLEVGQQSASMDTLAGLADVLGVEVWELFDFEHQATPSELRSTLRKLIHDADEEKLRLALKVFRAVLR